MQEEGVIKFSYDHTDCKLARNKDFRRLLQIRNHIRKMGFIGVDKDGIGYGNISIRTPDGFVITGTQTGHIEIIDQSHLSEVTHYDFQKNYLQCRGKVPASSESLTHAALYQISDKINDVCHAHDEGYWKYYHGKLPTTNPNIPYGTVEMAQEIQRIYNENFLNNVYHGGVIIMGGHKDGIIGFSSQVSGAFQAITIKLL